MADRRVRWNGEEKLVLRRRVQELLAEGIERPLDAVRSAQKVLPRGRRREILHIGQVGWLFQSPAAHSVAMGYRVLQPRDGSALPAPYAFGSLPGREAIVDAFAGILRDALARLVASGELGETDTQNAPEPVSPAATTIATASAKEPVVSSGSAPRRRLRPGRRTAAR